ncbi:MAG: glutathione S-transferase family protein [Stellaceae bacterium]
MAEFTIYIGNKNYSSWSLRAWLMLKAAGVPFTEVLIPLYQAGSRTELLRRSPSGKVPVLHHEGRVVWDSLAIGEYLAEQAPTVWLWPEEASARAAARAASAEMHSGFQALRRHLPMNMRRHVARALTPECQADLDRVFALWEECRRRYAVGGDYLFGRFCIADAMFAPVVSRLRTYGVACTGIAGAYADRLWAYPAFQDWAEAARTEPMTVDQFEL